jgi:hypothetical protein
VVIPDGKQPLSLLTSLLVPSVVVFPNPVVNLVNDISFWYHETGNSRASGKGAVSSLCVREIF